MTELRHPVIGDDSLETTVPFSQGPASSDGEPVILLQAVQTYFYLTGWKFFQQWSRYISGQIDTTKRELLDG